MCHPPIAFAASGLLRRLVLLRTGLALTLLQLVACAEPATPPPPAPRAAADAPAPDRSDHWCDLRSRVCR